ncbi:MAG: hypothetical protein IPN46_18480 [Saprospiraceae bacterium]|nr:hypothetical protein [Saprospiraceae bacterium]
MVDKGINMSEDEFNKYLNQNGVFFSRRRILAKYKDDYNRNRAFWSGILFGIYGSPTKLKSSQNPIAMMHLL